MVFTVDSLVSLATLLTLINAVQGCASSASVTHSGLTSPRQVNSAVGEQEVFPAVPASLETLPASESSLRITHQGLTSRQRSNFSSSGLSLSLGHAKYSGRMSLSLNWGGEPHMWVNGGGKVEDG
ncbi:hypothetical protein B0H13DRAFT_1922288 [Mycena leptocephala]|nr:hypothetical protein B0H13DRAFT_1922288 [Mycena leptocephala]